MMCLQPAMPVDCFQFHHIGIATKAPEAAFSMLEAMGYACRIQGWESNQKVNIALYEHPLMPRMEIIWNFSESSPIVRFIDKRDATFYHICYMTECYEKTLEYFHSVGRVLQISTLISSTLFENTSVAFHFIQGIGLVEILHAPSD